jgi:hypothetical protein
VRQSAVVTRRDIRSDAREPLVREDGRVAVPELAPRRTLGGVVAVWVLAALIGVVVGVFAAAQWRGAWLAVGLGGCLVAAFAIQLWSGRSQGFTERVAASVLGAALVMGVISLGFGLASIVPG